MTVSQQEEPIKLYRQSNSCHKNMDMDPLDHVKAAEEKPYEFYMTRFSTTLARSVHIYGYTLWWRLETWYAIHTHTYPGRGEVCFHQRAHGRRLYIFLFYKYNIFEYIHSMLYIMLTGI